jgi:hypothetical protein
MPVKEAVKVLLAKCDITLTEVVKRLNEKYGRTDTVQNLSKKVNNGTLRYNEAEEIADALGYTIEWVPKNRS